MRILLLLAKHSLTSPKAATVAKRPSQDVHGHRNDPAYRALPPSPVKTGWKSADSCVAVFDSIRDCAVTVNQST